MTTTRTTSCDGRGRRSTANRTWAVWISAVIGAAISVSAATVSAAEGANRPNVVMILADDKCEHGE